MSTPSNPIARLDVPLADVEREVRVQHLLYPTADDWARVKATHIKADPGEQAEYRHLLHDADPDSTVPPFVDLTKRTRSQS